MRGVLQFIVGYWLGRICTIIALLIVGLLLIGSHRSPPGPVPAQRASEQSTRQAALSQAYEEEQRQARYATRP